MFEETVYLHTVDVAPRTVHVFPCLRLLPGVVVVEKLVKYSLPFLWSDLIAVFVVIP